MANDCILKNYQIEKKIPPFIIAEMSGNHNQSLERALAIVDEAAKAGAHAIKLQTYTADTMTIDCDNKDFRITNPDSLWAGRTLYELYQEAHTPWEWHTEIYKRARERGLIPMSTPFDETSVDFLESLGNQIYKISSLENNDYTLIKKVAKTGKPMIISLGMMSEKEIIETVNFAKSHGCEDLFLLKCTSSYPALPRDANLLTIPYLRKLTGCAIGLSDHTKGTTVALASVVFGVCIIEKHITLSRSDGGVDSEFSIEPEELRYLVRESNRVFESLGEIKIESGNEEDESRKYRRSIYVIIDVNIGDEVSPERGTVIPT